MRGESSAPAASALAVLRGDSRDSSSSGGCTYPRRRRNIITAHRHCGRRPLRSGPGGKPSATKDPGPLVAARPVPRGYVARPKHQTAVLCTSAPVHLRQAEGCRPPRSGRRPCACP